MFKGFFRICAKSATPSISLTGPRHQLRRPRLAVERGKVVGANRGQSEERRRPLLINQGIQIFFVRFYPKISREFGKANNYSTMVKCHTRFWWRKGSLIIRTPFVVNIRIFLVGNHSISQTTSSGSVLARNMGLVFKAGVKFTGTGFIVSM